MPSPLALGWRLFIFYGKEGGEQKKDSLFLKADLEEKKKELEALRKKYRPYD